MNQSKQTHYDRLYGRREEKTRIREALDSSRANVWGKSTIMTVLKNKKHEQDKVDSDHECVQKHKQDKADSDHDCVKKQKTRTGQSRL